ncbi:MAG: GNAT family N-acetyltransferase [Phycisphaerales bacterium JB040]
MGQHVPPPVTIRHPNAIDRAAFVALRRSSLEHLKAWEPDLGDDERQFGDASFDRLLARCDDQSEQKFVILNDEGSLVGYVGLGQIYRGPFCSCYMGYWIGAAYARRGYGAAGVRACLTRAFAPEREGGLGLHRVEANIIPENRASLALARRVGFRREGYSPRYLKIAGRWQDHERWAITQEDWAELNARACAGA